MKLSLNVLLRSGLIGFWLSVALPVHGIYQPDTAATRIIGHPPQSLMPYWDVYMRQPDAQSVNTLYAKISVSLPGDKERILNELAYIKCLTELSVIRESAALLRKTAPKVRSKHGYILGVYHLVKARLLFRLGFTQEAIQENARAIALLENTRHTAELQNALLNQGFFYAETNPGKAFQYYDRARILESKGENAFALLLRTNLAFQYLKAKQPEEALRFCKEADIRATHMPQVYYLDAFRIDIIYASVYEMQGNFPQEDMYLEKARQLALSHSMWLNLKQIYHSQSVNFARKGDYVNAWNWLSEMDSLEKTMGWDKLSGEWVIQDMKMRVSQEKYRKQQAEQQLWEKRQEQRLLAVTLCGLLGILLLILWLLLRIKRKNKVLMEQNLLLARSDNRQLRSESALSGLQHSLIEGLEKRMYEDELYKEPGLSVERLAKLLQTNRTYLSEAINLHYKKSYSQWINDLRVGASRKMLASGQFDQYSIEGIARMVGYTSISSFNTSFKRYTGLTPSQFKKMRVSANQLK